MGPVAGLDVFEKRKISYPYQESNLNLSDAQPIA
jgi:hypothetical protein